MGSTTARVGRRAGAALGAVIAVTAMSTAPAFAETWNGGAGNDQHTGTAQADVLRGGDGADTLKGAGGGDTLYGGNGADKLYGGDGADVIWAGMGHDELYGGEGNDRLHADDGMRDTLVCGAGGSDVAYVDWRDKVGATCEGVVRSRITHGDLVAMFGARVGDKATVVKGLDSLNNQMRVGQIHNARRASAFLATVLNESAMKYNALQSGSSTYRGRGFMQLTNDFNYRAAGNYFGINLLASPDKARSLAWSAKIARWYWYNNRHANGPADQMDMGRISALIGYAPSAAEDRQRCEDFKRAMKHLTGTRPADSAVTCLRH